MVIFNQEMAFVSLLSGYIVAVQLHEDQAYVLGQESIFFNLIFREILWELKLNDVALKLLHCENRVYAMLANGTLAVLEVISDVLSSIRSFFFRTPLRRCRPASTSTIFQSLLLRSQV